MEKKHFNALSKEIGTRWKRFARHLNIPDYITDNIANQYGNDQSRCYNVFCQLERSHGSVKWKLIQTVLQELELNKIILDFSLKYHCTL